MAQWRPSSLWTIAFFSVALIFAGYLASSVIAIRVNNLRYQIHCDSIKYSRLTLFRIHPKEPFKKSPELLSRYFNLNTFGFLTKLTSNPIFFIMKIRGHPRRSLSDGLAETITRQVKVFMEAKDLNNLDIEKQAGIDNATLSKLLHGKRAWTLDQLEKLAPVLGVHLTDFFREPSLHIPVVAEVTGTEGPSYDRIVGQDAMAYYDIQFKDDVTMLAKIYALRVKDRSMMPSFPPGSLLIAQRDTAGSIKSEDFVVYCDNDNQAHVRQIFIKNGNIILRSLAQSVEDLVLPSKHIALCDRIVRVEFIA